jgi:hypothetical protein
MAIVGTKVGDGVFLAQMTALHMELRLYVNAHAPGYDDDPTAYVEPVGGGYGVADMPAVNWGVANADPFSYGFYPPITYAFTAAVTVRGYFVLVRGTTQILFAEAFTAPFVFGAGGGPLQISLVLGLQ